MGRLYVASVLISNNTNKATPAKTADVELAPIVPGAWAAWARNWDEQPSSDGTALAVPTPSTTLRPAASKA